MLLAINGKEVAGAFCFKRENKPKGIQDGKGDKEKRRKLFVKW